MGRAFEYRKDVYKRQGEDSERNAGDSDCFDYRRFAGNGIHGLLWRRVKD